MLDLGITKYLLEFTREYLQSKVSNKAVKEMDHRLCNSTISGLNRCKKWLRKCIEIYCQRLSQYNESDDFRYR